MTTQSTTPSEAHPRTNGTVAAAAASASSMADPGAWAVSAFATTSFMLGMYNAHLISAAGATIVLPVAFFFGGFVQLIVAVIEIGRGNLFGAVVFGTYGPFWIIYGAIGTIYGTEIPSGSAGSALALFLAMFAVLTFYFVIASLRTDAVLVGVLSLIFVGLVCLAIGEGDSSTLMTKIGGWVTLVFAVLAWYHAASDLVASTFGHRTLPVWSLRR